MKVIIFALVIFIAALSVGAIYLPIRNSAETNDKVYSDKTCIKEQSDEAECERILEENGSTNYVVKTTVVNVKEDPVYKKYYSDQDAIDIAKLLYAECGGVPSVTEQACVAWTVLNRIDQDGSTVHTVLRIPGQYAFFENMKVDEKLLDLAYDVLERWNREQNGEEDVGRVLPKGYIYFEGDGYHNYFRDQYRWPYNVWDYSLESPYES